MTGTEKQITWAEDIKSKTIDGLDNCIKFNEDYAAKYGLDYADRAEMYRIVKQAIENMFFCEMMQSAAFIISHRNDIPDANKVIGDAMMISRNSGKNKFVVLRELCNL